MKFAVNYSPQAADVLRQGRIDIDLFKCPDWDDLVAAARELRPTYVHFPIIVGNGSINQVDWGRVEHFLNTTDTTYVNTHLAPQMGDFPDPDDMDRIMQQLRGDIGALVERFGADRVLLEHVPYSGSATETDYLPLTADPGIYQKMVNEFGVGMVIDLSHARLTARHFGLDERGYVASLPVKVMRELHITGIQKIDGEDVDHMHLSDIDWRFVEWAFASIKQGLWNPPDVVTFEYGGTTDLFDWRSDPEIIAQQVPPLREMMQKSTVAVG